MAGGVIIFDPDDRSVGFSVGDDQAAGAYLDIENDALYLTDLTNIIKWEGDAAANMTYTWRSGKIRSQAPINLAAAVVDAESYVSVVFRLYAEVDGVSSLITTVGVADDKPFRLPGGYLSNNFEIEIISTDRIASVAVGQSIIDLAAEE
jgi:hypothetical protein